MMQPRVQARVEPSLSRRVLFVEGDLCLLKKAVGVQMPCGLTKKARRRFSQRYSVIQKVRVSSVSESQVCVELLEEKGWVWLLTVMEAQNRLVKLG